MEEKNCATSSVDRIWLMAIAMSLDSLDGPTSRIWKFKISRIESNLLLFYCEKLLHFGKSQNIRKFYRNPTQKFDISFLDNQIRPF